MTTWLSNCEVPARIGTRVRYRTFLGEGSLTQTVFTKVDYDLGSLIKYIERGEIGLPDIQRPFVWSNIRIRDLFDSFYCDYPVGPRPVGHGGSL